MVPPGERPGAPAGAEKVAEIEQGDAAIADALGARPVGFRTPSCDVDREGAERPAAGAHGAGA